ncbi:MAG: division/cell wall cluster transcriptional repressor MraZ [Pseudomonadota bacterium]
MAQRFRGESIHKVDGKGRVSIPALFRRVLEAGDPSWADGLNPNLVIVYGGASQKYLEVYTQDAIAEVDDKIARLPRGSKERRVMEHIFNSQSLPTQTDDTGRLVLPQKLRDKAGISNEAYFKASGDTFQIWAPDAHDMRNEDIEAWLSDKGDDFDPLTLLELVPQPQSGA